MKKTADELKDKAEKKVDKVENQVEKAADKVAEKADKAKDKAEAVVDKAEEKVKKELDQNSGKPVVEGSVTGDDSAQDPGALGPRPYLPLTHCVTLGKSLPLSGLSFLIYKIRSYV